jgi:hypothetical protein
MVIALWFVKTFFLQKNYTDFFGIFLFIFFTLYFVYNIYTLLLYKFYFENKKHKIRMEVIFILLLLFPFFILWYFTS